MKKPALVLLLLLFPLISFGFDNNFKSFEKRFQAVQSFQTIFTQEYYLSLEERSLHFEGVFYYKRPGLMRWVYQVPEPQEVIVGREKIWVVDPILETVTVQPVNEVKSLASLSFLFSSKSLTKNYKQTQTKSSKLSAGAGVRYYLAPKKANNQLAELQLRVDPKAGHLLEFVIVDLAGNYRKITLKNTQILPLSNNRFQYQIPPEMEIIDTMSP